MSPERHDPFVLMTKGSCLSGDTSRDRVEQQKSLSKKGESKDKLEMTTNKRKSESPEDREEAKRPTLSESATRMIHRTLPHEKKTKMVRDPDTGRWRREVVKSGDYFRVSGFL